MEIQRCAEQVDRGNTEYEKYLALAKQIGLRK